MFSRKKKRRSKNGIIEVMNGLLGLLVLGVLIAVGTVVFVAQQFGSPGPTTEERRFQVARNEGLATIAEQLEGDGIIASQWIFQAGAFAQRKSRAIKAGEFRIAAGASMADVLKELTEGVPVTYKVTIPEGFTSNQVVARLLADENLSGEIAAVPSEGSLLPDTYVYERGDDRQAILGRMAAALEARLAEVWEGRDPDLPIESPQQLVTLASIVEKETGVADERPEVAGVFINRLKFNMRLQSDPTIIYGLTKGLDALGHELRQSEIASDTAYNTYVIHGLPPGPIANPGIEALMAAAHPADTKALYFVADGSGGHAFAASYDEHQKNKRRWDQIKRQRAAEAEAKDLADADAARDALEAKEAEAAGETISSE